MKENETKDKCMLLSKHISLDLEDSRCTSNVLAIGGPGCGKFYNLILPNFLQAHSNYIVHDVGGEIYRQTHTFFANQGYDVKVLDFANYDLGKNHYNPFIYLKKEADAMQFTNCIFKNIDGIKEENPFFADLGRNILYLLIGYVKMYAKEETVDTLMDAIQNFDEVLSKMTEVDNGDTRVAENVRISATKETLKQNLQLLAAQLELFRKTYVKKLTSMDDLDLEHFADKKTILYVITSHTEQNLLVPVFFSQAYRVLFEKAEKKALKEHITFILDECSFMGTIIDLPYYLATSRERKIHTILTFQSIEQLKYMFPDDYNSIVGVTAKVFFYAQKNIEDIDFCLQNLGVCTVMPKKGPFQPAKHRKLLEEEKSLEKARMELFTMKTDTCIVVIQNKKPVCDTLYNPKKHENYSKLRK